MKLNLRTLNADEIKPRIAKTNGGGVTLLLWKSAVADMQVLDDAMATTEYSIEYPRENVCRISLYDEEKDTWVSKEGVGEGTSPKNMANDALARAGMAWGIGRELFTAGELFIYKDKLKSYSETVDENGKKEYDCFDRFAVSEIRYTKNRTISYIKIDISSYGKVHNSVDFSFNNDEKATPVKTSHTDEPAIRIYSEAANETPVVSATINNDEVILIGNCRGKTYGEVKDTETFLSFLKWAKDSGTRYDDAKKADQLMRFKALACNMCA